MDDDVVEFEVERMHRRHRYRRVLHIHLFPSFSSILSTSISSRISTLFDLFFLSRFPPHAA
jgi:hypothetical protein